MFHKIIALATLLFIAANSPQDKVKKPPEGPPWHTDYKKARWEALRSGKPLFLYFTKTY